MICLQRDTIKRMCIKSLPSMLCIQLKRFSWDWETNRAIKFDDFFKVGTYLLLEMYVFSLMSFVVKELWSG